MLYIISGKYKGFQLKMVPSEKTRHTTHLVRKVIFDTIGHWIKDKKVLDLFAGSGACGFESLSRQSKEIYLVDNSVLSFKTMMFNRNKLNLKSDCCKLFRSDYWNIINFFFKKKIFFDLIIIDPPYNFDFYIQLLQKIDFLIKDKGLVVCETYKTVLLPDKINNLEIIKNKKFSNKKIKFYKKKKN